MLGKWSASGLSILSNMNRHYNAMSKSMLRISTGYRINSAADDPAGLAISEKMRAQIRGLNMASKNIQDGISLVQTAEGALNETHAMIQRMRELAVQASNDTLTDSDRHQLDLEFQELKKEIQRLSKDTEFNTRTLLNGDYSTNGLKIQAGANAGQTIELFINDMGAGALGLDATTSIATRDNANNAISSMDEALKRVSSERSRLGAYQNRLEHAYNANVNTAENLTAAESRIRDADIAKEMMNMVKSQILLQASQYVLALHMQQAQSILKLLESGTMRNPRY
ncbi:flagellin [Lysinibacillus sphaericus]|uniref:Flagellin n=2 Tax=Lysinibacillus TaxID=400634 RepID=A0A2S0K4Z2_LYSSH|nr:MULTISPECIES: flagellin [Lysinibacillus]AVK98408.1 flagellin [Lysinibacillus sphaericus]MED4543935.1 flagellin [Lysinibacillus sphaericus]TKI18401.1 flagellin [Lysinibacillus sphaericus]TKI48793.1 flagellin [Lysinibacillus tabacifolii]SUV15627.1 flagellin domain-containing protein [Lysinibacillus sphaericus]